MGELCGFHPVKSKNVTLWGPWGQLHKTPYIKIFLKIKSVAQNTLKPSP